MVDSASPTRCGRSSGSSLVCVGGRRPKRDHRSSAMSVAPSSAPTVPLAAIIHVVEFLRCTDVDRGGATHTSAMEKVFMNQPSESLTSWLRASYETTEH